jgi:hypothetical protein
MTVLLECLVLFARVPAKKFDQSLRPQIGQVVSLQSYEHQWKLRTLNNDRLAVPKQEPIRSIQANPSGAPVVSNFLDAEHRRVGNYKWSEGKRVRCERS